MWLQASMIPMSLFGFDILQALTNQIDEMLSTEYSILNLFSLNDCFEPLPYHMLFLIKQVLYQENWKVIHVCYTPKWNKTVYVKCNIKIMHGRPRLLFITEIS